MKLLSAAGTVRVLGSGRWNEDDESMGSYVDLYDADEGDTLRCSVMREAGPPPAEGDVIECILSSRVQSKAVGSGEGARVVERVQLRLAQYKVVARLVMQPVAAETPELAEVA